MTKDTCIVGSARNDGSCAHLTDAFIKGLNTKAQIKKYCVSDMDLHFCKGCKNCYEMGECVTRDDVQSVVGDIMTSDYVFMAAPSYWAGVPAQLKALFDRTTPYGDTNPKRCKANGRNKGYSRRGEGRHSPGRKRAYNKLDRTLFRTPRNTDD